MKEIAFSGKIGAGLKFKVSDKSFKKVSKRTLITLQRYLKNFPKGVETDHRDGDKLNYQLANLRPATHQQNAMNRGRQKNNYSSKYKGVCWHDQRQKWYARIHISGKQISCGLHSSQKKAAIAYDKKAKKLFGNFAKLNFQ
jgi:hypothetical protein